MDKLNYDIIIGALDERISTCSDNFDKIKTTEDISNLSISEAIRLRALARDEIDRMTTIAMVDLYHVIGMGNLTAVQLSEFIKKIKIYIKYRPIIKSFANNLSSLDDLPKPERDTMYRLQELGGISLVNGNCGKAKEEFASIHDYKAKGLTDAIKSAELKFTLSGNTIILPTSQLENFCKYSGLIGCGGKPTVTTLKSKIEKCGEYCGIAWQGFDVSGNALGQVKGTSILTKMKTYLEIHQSNS